MKKTLKVIGVTLLGIFLLLVLVWASLYAATIYYDKTECKSDAECTGNQTCDSADHFGFCGPGDMGFSCVRGSACIENYCPKGKVAVTCNRSEDYKKYFPVDKKSQERMNWVKEKGHYCVNNDNWWEEVDKLSIETGTSCVAAWY